MRRIIDLSLTIDESMRGVEFAPARRLEQDGWNATTLTLYSHCGTHMDAPCHFLPDAAGLDRADLSASVGPARLIDLTPIAPRTLITVEMVADVVGPLQPGARLLLRTDWHKRHGTPAYRDELPRVSKELAHWLVENQVTMLGVEPPSVADVNNHAELTEVHHILMKGNVTIVEGLAHLDQITCRDFEFVALPLKIRDGDGAPARAIAILEVDDE